MAPHVRVHFDDAAVDDAHDHDDDYFHPIRLSHFGCDDSGPALVDPLDNIPN